MSIISRLTQGLTQALRTSLTSLFGASSSDMGASFRGFNNWIESDGQMGNLDSASRQFTFACKVYFPPEEGSGHRQIIHMSNNGSSGDHFGIARTGSNQLWVRMNNGTDAIINKFVNTTPFTTGEYTILVSADLVAGTCKIWLNGVSDDAAIINNAEMPFTTSGNIRIGALQHSTGTPVRADIRWLVLHAGEYVDLDLTENRAKFIDGLMDDTQDASHIFSTPPHMLFNGGYEDWATNKGVGGNFITTGTVGKILDPVVAGIKYDGSNDNIRFTEGLTTNIDPTSRSGTLAFKWNINNPDGSQVRLVQGTNGSTSVLYLARETDNTVRLILKNSAAQDAVTFRTVETMRKGEHRVLISWDDVTSSLDVYFNDTRATFSGFTLADNAVAYQVAGRHFDLGSNNNSAGRLDGDIDWFYWNTKEYIDLSVQANRDLFDERMDTTIDGSHIGLGIPSILFNGTYSEWPVNKGDGTNSADAIEVSGEPQEPTRYGLNFDGTSDSLRTTTSYSFGDDSDNWSIAIRFRPADVSTRRWIFAISESKGLRIDAGGAIHYEFRSAENPGNNMVVGIWDGGDAAVNGEWYTVFLSHDKNANRFEAWLDNVEDTPSLLNHETTVFSATWEFLGGVDSNDTFIWNGDIEFFYMDTENFVDWSDAGNRAMFYDKTKIANSVDGNILGFKPTVFFSGDSLDWHVNKGTRGTVIGAVSGDPIRPE